MKPLIVVVILMSFSFISATPAEDERADHGKMELFLTKSHLIIVNQKKILLRTRAVISNFNLFTAATDKKIIMNGINAFAKYTCIKFVLRTSDHADYVLFSQHSSG